MMLNVFASCESPLHHDSTAFNLHFGAPLTAMDDGHIPAGRTEVYRIKLKLQVVERALL